MKIAKERRFILIVTIGVIFIISIGYIAKKSYRSSLEDTIREEFLALPDPNFEHVDAFIVGSKGLEYHFVPKDEEIYQRIMNNLETFKSTMLFESCAQNNSEIHDGVKMTYKYFYPKDQDQNPSLAKNDPQFQFLEIYVANATCTYLDLDR